MRSAYLSVAAAAAVAAPSPQRRISPDNDVSIAFVRRHGFVEVGEQWDDEDGLEIVFEVAARTPAS